MTKKKPTSSALSDVEAKQRRQRAEQALRVISHADKYRGDKQLMKDVKNLAKEKVTRLQGYIK